VLIVDIDLCRRIDGEERGERDDGGEIIATNRYIRNPNNIQYIIYIR